MAKINWSVNVIDMVGNVSKIFQTQIEVKTASLISRFLKKRFLERGVDVFVNKAGEVAYSIGFAVGKITSKEFDEKAIEYLDRRYMWLIEDRFKHATGIWRKLKKSTIERRIYRVQEGWRGNPYGPPLIFTGNLKSAWTTSHRITKFEFFSKADYDKGLLKFKPFEIEAGWIQSELADRLEQDEELYFKSTTLWEPRFLHLGIYHANIGRQIWPSREIESIGEGGKVIKYKPWWKQTVYKQVVRPFIRRDFPNLMRLYIFAEAEPINKKVQNKIAVDLIEQAVEHLKKQGLFSGSDGRDIERKVRQVIVPMLKKEREKLKGKTASEVADIIRNLISRMF